VERRGKLIKENKGKKGGERKRARERGEAKGM